MVSILKSLLLLRKNLWRSFIIPNINGLFSEIEIQFITLVGLVWQMRYEYKSLFYSKIHMRHLEGEGLLGPQ